MTIEKRASLGPMMAAEGTGVVCVWNSEGQHKTNPFHLADVVLYRYQDTQGSSFFGLVFIHFHFTGIIGSVKIAISILQIKRRGVNHCPIIKICGQGTKYN